MGFWTLFEVASLPILQVLLLTLVGAFMATDYLNLLSADTRRSLNKIVFMVFTPSLMFSSLAETVTFEDIISWWFMPINIGLTFLIGGTLGWIAVKLVKPQPHLQGLVIATCSSGNLGNLMIIIIPAICNEKQNPFGDRDACNSVGISYASFSMALGGLFVWTYTYQLVRSSATSFKALIAIEEASMLPNKDFDANEKSGLLEAGYRDDMSGTENIVSKESPPSGSKEEHISVFHRIYELLYQIFEELLAPPTLAAIAGFIFGTIPFLKNLIVGDDSPLLLILDSLKLLGDGTIPCITLILGGNLTQGLRKATVRPGVIVAVICVRYILSPAIGICVVKAADHLGFLPHDPLYHFVLMMQFTVPPAMNIGTMTQLFGVAQEECSVLLLWTYLVAVLSLTVWSTVFMSIL